VNGAVRQECCSHDFTSVVDGVRVPKILTTSFPEILATCR